MLEADSSWMKFSHRLQLLVTMVLLAFPGAGSAYAYNAKPAELLTVTPGPVTFCAGFDVTGDSPADGVLDEGESAECEVRATRPLLGDVAVAFSSPTPRVHFDPTVVILAKDAWSTPVRVRVSLDKDEYQDPTRFRVPLNATFWTNDYTVSSGFMQAAASLSGHGGPTWPTRTVPYTEITPTCDHDQDQGQSYCRCPPSERSCFVATVSMIDVRDVRRSRIEFRAPRKVTEAGTPGTAWLRLGARPRGTVYVETSGSVSSELSLPANYRFSSSTWNIWQPVPLSAVDNNYVLKRAGVTFRFQGGGSDAGDTYAWTDDESGPAGALGLLLRFPSERRFLTIADNDGQLPKSQRPPFMGFNTCDAGFVHRTVLVSCNPVGEHGGDATGYKDGLPIYGFMRTYEAYVPGRGWIPMGTNHLDRPRSGPRRWEWRSLELTAKKLPLRTSRFRVSTQATRFFRPSVQQYTVR
ncbi:MAG: hypothetical protein JWN72_2920 [Thermoleophilia bacterium]|nr:hypothetical protein [Thermoleophilia bacterium]